MARKGDRVYMVTRPDTHSGGSFRARTAIGAARKSLRHGFMSGAQEVSVRGFCHREGPVRYAIHNGWLVVPGA
jgi:uncharacterized protein YaaW (UPF0174 family)